MTESECVLVTGGCGYIGSHVVRALHERGSQIVVLDDLSSGHADSLPRDVLLINGTILDSPLVALIIREHRVGAIIHFAARTQVGASVNHPYEYYNTNLVGSLRLLEAALATGVKKFVFSSTAAIFGEPTSRRIDERHMVAPLNPYGRSKAAVENLLKDFDAAYGLRNVCLRYFNAAGAWPGGDLGERHQPETHLIPLALQAAMGESPELKVFGNDYPTADGTCYRDYVHVMDLAQAHLLALDYLSHNEPSNAFNLGNGDGFSVLQVLEAVQQVTGRSVPFEFAPRRAGDPAVLVADSTHAQNILGWQPTHASLHRIVHDAFVFYRRAGGRHQYQGADNIRRQTAVGPRYGFGKRAS